MTNHTDSFCSKCGKSGHLAGACTNNSQHVRKPVARHPAERVFEKKEKFTVASAKSPDPEMQELAAQVAELTEENRQLKLRGCPKCDARRKYNTQLKRQLRSKAGAG